LQWISEKIPPPFDDLAYLISKYIGDFVNIYVGSEAAGLDLKIEGEGLGTMFNNLILLRGEN
jgi:hypothetical protein